MALKQSWLDERLYNVMQHDRNIGMYTKYLQYKLVNYTEVIVIKTRPTTTTRATSEECPARRFRLQDSLMVRFLRTSRSPRRSVGSFGFGLHEVQ